MFRSCFVFGWLFLVAGLALAREPLPVRPLNLLDLGAPSFTSFSSRDGLPDTVTVSICTDRDGFVWAATPIGVFRYDGRRWVASDDPAMAHSVDSLWVDRQGTLWAAFRSDGLAHYDGSHWHVESRHTGLPSQQIRRFTETTDAADHSTLWALTWDHGLMLHRDGHWQADPDNASLPDDSILAMAQTRDLGGHRRQWAGTGSNGLWYREEGHAGWQRWHHDGFDTSQVEFLLTTEHAGHEELWISVFGAGLWRLTDQGLQHWSKEAGELPTDDIYDIAATPAADGDRAIWVSSRAGLIRLHDDHVQAFDQRNGLPSNGVRAVYAWRSPGGNEVIWLATERGIARTVLGVSAWSTASLLGTRSTGVFALLVEPDDDGGERLWVGSNKDGLGLYDRGRWRHFTQADGTLPDPSVSAIAVTRDAKGERTRWIGLRDGDLVRVREGPVFERQQTPWPKRDGNAVLDVLARVQNGQQELWVATRETGTWRLIDGHWMSLQPPGISDQWRVVKLQQQVDVAGRSWLWATTNHGLARFDGQQWKLFGREIGLPDGNLLELSLIDDARGHPILWMGTSSAGIARVDVNDPSHPQLLPANLPAPPDSTSYGALRDSTGRIYICTNNGVQQLTPAGGGWQSRVFNRADGMVNDECNTNAQLIDAHDRYWAGTLGGLTVYDPHNEEHDSRPKPLKITAMRVDGTIMHGSALQTNTHARDIDIQFALLSWYRESESRFRTQLIGYEAAPGAWTADDSRSFNALPPGDYQLRIEARDHAGNASTPIELPIIIRAQWWQQSWARVAGVLALLLLGYLMALWRLRRLHAQRHALEQRVISRTAELHDANARLLDLSYSDALTGLANRRCLLERLEHCHEAANASMRTALIFVDVDHFKDYNDHHGHPAGDEALRIVAATLRRCAPADTLVARYGGEEFACLLPGVDMAQAVSIAEAFRTAVAGSDIAIPGTNDRQHVTISAGVASMQMHSTDDAHRLLRNADAALYRAKDQGRNCVRTQTPSGMPPD
jgi:diguanylate cyclase (GGDEF)-like protein